MSQKTDLATEFPQYRDLIHDLKLSNGHFARLFSEHDQIEHEIRRIEMNIQPATDHHLEELKVRRLHLKDELYGLVEQEAKRLPHPKSS